MVPLPMFDNNVTVQNMNCTHTGNNSPSANGDVAPESIIIIQSVIACVGNHWKFNGDCCFCESQKN